MELSEELHNQIIDLSEQGESFLEFEKYDEALVKFQEALDLVPYPKKDWEASTWLYASIGDTLFSKQLYKESLNAFLDAYNCPDGTNNPFVNLKLGECYFELEEFEKAKEYLLRTYMLEGDEIFEEEEEDKYINELINNN